MIPKAKQFDSPRRAGFIASERAAAFGRAWATVADDYAFCQTDETRAAYADGWVAVTASYLARALPMAYELARLVRDQELWRVKDEMGREARTFEIWWRWRMGESFPSFDEFERIVTAPADTEEA